jgi:hypothetical protein
MTKMAEWMPEQQGLVCALLKEFMAREGIEDVYEAVQQITATVRAEAILVILEELAVGTAWPVVVESHNVKYVYHALAEVREDISELRKALGEAA